MYKNIIKVVVNILVIVGFTACGESDKETEPSTPAKNVIKESTVVHMKIGKVYTMQKGQTIVRKKDPTQIIVETNISSGESITKLISGEADIN